MKILIVKLSSLGDVVHTLPALSALRGAYPDAEIDWLVEEESKAILEGNPLLNNIVTVRKRGLFREPGKTWRVVRRIRERRYDMVIDFQGLLKSGVWVYLSSGRRRIGFGRGREFSHLFLNEKLPPYDPDRHAVDRYLDLARYAGGRVEEVRFPLTFTHGEEEGVFKLLKEGGIGRGDGFVVISPRARWETKLWGVERFGEVAREIVGRLNLKTVVVGSRADRGYGDEIASCGDGTVNLAGRTALKELAFLMKVARFVVSVDSGPLHVATAVGTPVVALFGPTAPWRTGPYGRNHIIIRGEAECSPCFSRRCRRKDVVCMKDITVHTVMDGVAALLKEGRGPSVSLMETAGGERAVGCNHRD